jgi:acetyl-CoA synthetase
VAGGSIPVSRKPSAVALILLMPTLPVVVALGSGYVSGAVARLFLAWEAGCLGRSAPEGWFPAEAGYLWRGAQGGGAELAVEGHCMPETERRIIKSPSQFWVSPNLEDYDAVRAAFSWELASRALEGLPGGQGLNIAHAAVDRHALGAHHDQLALRWLGKNGQTRDYTYANLYELTNRFANVLRQLGVGKGERVFVVAGRVPEVYIATLGILKNRSVFCPLYSAFGPEPVRPRIDIGQPKVLVTTRTLFEGKITAIRPALPSIEHILLAADDQQPTAVTGTLDFHALMREASAQSRIGPTDPEDVALLHFTSGTTGKPKGAVHVHQAVLAHHINGQLALDLHPTDIFWCTADPGWVTGTSYGIIAPLTNGVTSIVDEADLDMERWYRILQDQRVSVWYTAPTAIRMLMKAGTEPVHRYDLRVLRFLASVGEPLNPEGVVWGQEAYGLPFHDNWWQTETGGIMIANFAALDIRPGSVEGMLTRHG